MADIQIHFEAIIRGRSAELVIDKISEYAKAHNGRTIGKSRATELLLCELWNLKKVGTDNKPCD